jgi:hypothetical protein
MLALTDVTNCTKPREFVQDPDQTFAVNFPKKKSFGTQEASTLNTPLYNFDMNFAKCATLSNRP